MSGPFLEAYDLQHSPPLHPSMIHAHISVIPKEKRDTKQCNNFRTISLLNVDLKLFAKILARRLAAQLKNIVYYDQVGFMPDREARDGTIRAIDLNHKINKDKQE